MMNKSIHLATIINVKACATKHPSISWMFVLKLELAHIIVAFYPDLNFTRRSWGQKLLTIYILHNLPT